MADRKISDLSAVTTILSTDEFVLARSGVTNKITGTDLVAFLTVSGGEMAYNEFTSAVNPTATTEGTADTVVTASAFTADGVSAYMVEFFTPAARPDTGAAGRSLSFWLYEDGSSIGRVGFMPTPAAASDLKPVFTPRRLVPSGASHTYSIRASVSAGTGAIDAGAGGAGNQPPGFIRIRKVT